MPERNPRDAPTLDRSTELAFERTRVAYERTMMAWIRTATSLITFGFTIYKLFQLEGLSHPQPRRLIGPREFAFISASIGLISLLLATFEHRQNIRTLGAQYEDRKRSLAVLVAALVSVLGVVAPVAMIFGNRSLQTSENPCRSASRSVQKEDR
jgi:putative membrane protein